MSGPELTTAIKSVENILKSYSTSGESSTFNEVAGKIELKDKLIEARKLINNILTTTTDSISSISESINNDIKNIEQITGFKINSRVEISEFKDNTPNNTAQENNWSLVRNKTPSKAKYTNEEVAIVSGISLNARVVENWNSIGGRGEKCDIGYLYYVRHTNTFCMRLGSKSNFIYGNIGEIFNYTDNIHRVKTCNIDPRCQRRNCGYFHDPIIYPEKKEFRNFVDNSWMYTRGNNDKCQRSIGSRSTLHTDVLNLDNSDDELHSAQLMHDVLCLLVIRKYKNI